MKRKYLYISALALLVIYLMYEAFKKQTRNLVGKMKSNGSYPTRIASQIEGIAIHHTATSQEATPEQINKIHLDRGWPGIGYHYLIYADGKEIQVQDDLTISNHVANNNTKLIGISFVGNYTQNPPTLSMYRTGRKRIRKLKKKYGELFVKKHGSFSSSSTACPGNINLSKL